MSLVRRHDVLEAGHDLGAGVEDRFANVSFVGDGGAAVAQVHNLVVQLFQHRTFGVLVRAVTAQAAILQECLAALQGVAALGVGAQPAVKVGRLHGDDLAVPVSGLGAWDHRDREDRSLARDTRLGARTGAPLRARGVEEALSSGAGAATAAQRAGESTEPPSDPSGSAEYRRHLAEVLVRRALEAL